MKIEYEKVKGSIFDLREDFERGELFTKKFNQEYHQIKTEVQLGGLLSMNDDPTKNGIYRRIEKPVDWRYVVKELMQKFGETSPYTSECEFDDDGLLINATFTEEEFKELCCSVAESVKYE